jgi:hypothetical protein
VSAHIGTAGLIAAGLLDATPKIHETDLRREQHPWRRLRVLLRRGA